MSSPAGSADVAMESHEMKSDVSNTLSPIPAGEQLGTHSEDHDIGQFGYKPELERRFGMWSMIGLSCTIMVTWEGWFTIFATNLTDGGPAGCVYAFLLVWLGYTAVVCCLSELVSMMPTAAGQYHWVYILAPPKCRKFVSWITGWQIVLGWQADLAVVVYLGGTIIQAMAVLNYPDYGFQRWHGTLIMWGVVGIAITFNTTLARWLPWIEGGILITHVLGFVVVLVPLVYFGPRVSAHDVFAQFLSLGGYSDGTAFFVGFLTSALAFMGADGAIHMSEEVRQARTAVPYALLSSVAINGILAFGMLIAVLFTVGNLDMITEILTPKTGVTFVDYFYNTLQDAGFATGLTSLLLFLFIFCAVAVLCSTSRVTWAFARDDGLPGSRWIKRVSPTSHLPLYAIGVSGLISCLLSLINIGSAVGFNIVVSIVVASFFGSYMIPIGLMIWKRATNQPLELGPWNLGRWGLPVHIFSFCWLLINWIFSFFPAAIPVTLTTMNWSCLIWGSIVIFGLLYYFLYRRHRFSGPQMFGGYMEVR